MKALAYSLAHPKKAEHSYLPDFTASSVDDIDFAQLRKMGIKHLLFDLDQTLRRPYSRKLDEDVVTLLKEVNTSKHFISLNLVSNNHRKLHRFSNPIGARVFQPFRRGLRIIRKPNPDFFRYVLGEIGTAPEHTVMIGDRLHADVLGGNKMGMYTIYVRQRGPVDYWFDWLLFTRKRDEKRLRAAIANHHAQQKSKKQ